MFTRRVKVVKDVGAGATRVFKSIGKDTEPGRFKDACWKEPVVVGGMGKRDNGWCLPCGIAGDGAEGIASDASKKAGLSSLMCRLRAAQAKEGCRCCPILWPTGIDPESQEMGSGGGIVS